VPLQYAKILCAIDFDKSANVVLSHAKLLAAATGGTLHLLHVVPLTKNVATLIRHRKAGADTPAYDKLQEIAEGELERTRHEVHVRFATSSEIAKSILETVDELHADLLVVATHGRSGVPHLLLGSVAEELVRKAACAVLTVRPKPEVAN
jgi:nucleotide-binding universal stress UspA family protein